MPRPLTIVADDYGIGRATSQGILDLALEGRITATVLIVNSPDAELAVREWGDARPPADLGWHPNLTLDRPILPPGEVPSLVRPDGTFWPLPQFLRRACLGQIPSQQVLAEWRAQYTRFLQLVGRPPDLINSHQHVSLFPPCDEALLYLLQEVNVRPYVRRVLEPASALARVAGARLKRTALSLFGQRAARRGASKGLPGCDWLAGVTDPACVRDERFWQQWLNKLTTGSVEVCCHPGYLDPSLVGRDCSPGDGLMRRPRETALLRSRMFRETCDSARLIPVRPSAMACWRGAVA